VSISLHHPTLLLPRFSIRNPVAAHQQYAHTRLQPTRQGISGTGILLVFVGVIDIM
jgi:hypothetical protein